MNVFTTSNAETADQDVSARSARSALIVVA